MIMVFSSNGRLSLVGLTLCWNWQNKLESLLPKPHQSFLKFPSIFTLEQTSSNIRNRKGDCSLGKPFKKQWLLFNGRLNDVKRLIHFVHQNLPWIDFGGNSLSFTICQRYFLVAFVTRYIVTCWHYCKYKTFCLNSELTALNELSTIVEFIL